MCRMYVKMQGHSQGGGWRGDVQQESSRGQADKVRLSKECIEKDARSPYDQKRHQGQWALRDIDTYLCSPSPPSSSHERVPLLPRRQGLKQASEVQLEAHQRAGDRLSDDLP